MDLFVLNDSLDAVRVIDSYKSLIWTGRHQECGDFELRLVMTDDLLSYVRQDWYLWINESDYVMIIEKIQITTDVESGKEAIITGRSLESILDRRVVWGLKMLSGNLQNGIQELLNENIINPTKPERKIPNFVFEPSTDPKITELTIDTQYTGDNLYDIVTTICSERKIGFKISINDNKQFVFRLYAGTDRTYDQTTHPYVVFSPNFDNIVNSNYVDEKNGLKNVTLVGGEGEGSERRYTAVGNVSGLNRREIFTDARDISSDCDEDITALFKLSPIMLTNIVPNGGFESDSGWIGGAYDTSQFHSGSRSLRISPGVGTPISSVVDPPIVGHKYYGRRSIKSETDYTKDDRFEIYASDGYGLNFVFLRNSGYYPDWTTHSSIVTIPAVNGTNYTIRCFIVGAPDNRWVDDLMIVDLTKSFGAGQEPTKEWLDENIPWFETTYAYDCDYPSRAFNISTNGFVVDDNFNSTRVNISAYVGRTLSITIPKYNNENGVVPSYGLAFLNSAGTVISSKAWEKYDDESKSKGSLASYEVLIPTDAKFVVATMFSQAAIDNDVYYGSFGDFSCTTIKISNTEYVAQLRQRGKEKLAENIRLVSFDGEVDPYAMFRFGEDYFIGDTVQVIDEYGHESKSMITEIIMSEDESGYTIYPTFSTIEAGYLPNNYLELTCIESNGTQYIDTKIKPTQELRVIFTFETVDPGINKCYFGSQSGSTLGDAFACVFGTSIETVFGGDSVATGLVPSGITTIDKNKNVTTIGSKVVENLPATFSGAYNLFLFANNSGGIVSGLSSIKLYSCQIYDGNVLIRDFVPCKNETDVVGLYDMVDGVFYGNAGSGSFIAG